MSTIRSYIISKCARRSTRTRPRNTSYSNALADMAKRRIGSISPTTLRMFEFQLSDVFLFIFIVNMDRKHNVVELFIFGPPRARMALSRMVRQRMAGSAITFDNARVTHRLVQGDLYGDVRVRRSQLLSKSLESGFHLWSCALFRFLVLSGSFMSRQQQLPWTRREVYR